MGAINLLYVNGKAGNRACEGEKQSIMLAGRLLGRSEWSAHWNLVRVLRNCSDKNSFESQSTTHSYCDTLITLAMHTMLVIEIGRAHV